MITKNYYLNSPGYLSLLIGDAKNNALLAAMQIGRRYRRISGRIILLPH